MRLMIESTDMVTTVNGVRVRWWRGLTEAGNKVEVFVHTITVDTSDAPDAALQACVELNEIKPPRELRAVPLRDILR